jgi:hypothetical protein
MKDAARGAKVRANLHLGDDLFKVKLSEANSNEPREERCEESLHCCEVEHGVSLRRLTFELTGMRNEAKPTVACPVD